MITIQKNNHWFLVTEAKWASWAIEVPEEGADFITYANEKSAKKSKIKTFDWPGEYEKKWAEIRWIEIWDDWLVSYLCKIDWRKILSIYWNLEGFNPEKFNKIDDEIDVLIVNILEKTDVNILIKIIEQSWAKIVAMSWAIDRVKEKITNIQIESEIKITTIPEEKIEYYQL